METLYAYEIVYNDGKDIHVVILESNFENAFRRAMEHAKINGFVLKEIRYIGTFI